MLTGWWSLGRPDSAVALPLAPVPSGRAAGLPSEAVWPLTGSPSVLRAFDPPVERWSAGHRGIDLAGSVGAQVLSVAAGRVTFAGTVGGIGVVTVDHGDVRSTYQPVRATVHVGASVRPGQPIGTLRGGHCDAPGADDRRAAAGGIGGSVCLHLGLRRGEDYLDPMLLFGSVLAIPGSYRLLPTSEIAAVRQRAAARAAAQAALLADRSAGAQGLLAGTGPPTPLGPPGRHGFSRPVPGGITSPFGRRFHPILHVWKLHDGTDFGAACGTPIRAPYAGQVVGRSFNAGYGNRLMIDHGTVDGHRVVSGYNHAIGYTVALGARVQRGQLIGLVGETGYATGCHLHLMTWIDGGLVDPMTWW